MGLYESWLISVLCKGWCDELGTGLNIIIAIGQKVKEWPSCTLAKMISLGVHHFGKRTVWSL